MKKRTKSFTLLALGVVALIAGIIAAVITYNSSYQESVAVAESLKEVKAQISEIEEEKAEGNLEALQKEKTALSAQKLSLERPYSYALITVFFGILLSIRGLYCAIRGRYKNPKSDVKRLAAAGLMAALCYIGFAFLKIDIPVGPEKTAFHFGNVFCVLAALLLGGYWGGLAGAIGMTIGDLTTSYVTSAPKTFLLKLCIGLTVGFVAHKIFRLGQEHSKKYITGVTIFSCVCGMVFNLVADPLVGYFYKMYLLGVPQDISAALAKISALTTGVNAVVAVIAASVFYLALRPALLKSGLILQVSPEKAKDHSCTDKTEKNKETRDA